MNLMTEDRLKLKPGYLLLAILAVAVCLRIGLAIHMGNRMFWIDEKWYDGVASNIANGNGFSLYGSPTTYHPPLYPGFVALCYTIFGHNVFAVRIVQAFVGAGTCYLLYILARRLFSDIAGYVAAAVAAIYPLFIYVNDVLYPETLSSFAGGGRYKAIALVEKINYVEVLLLYHTAEGLATRHSSGWTAKINVN